MTNRERKRENILTHIFKSGLVESLTKELLIEGYIGYDNSEDFLGEMYRILCEINSNKLVKLYMENQLQFYIISIVRNQARNKKSDFNRKYNKITLVPIIIDKDETEEEYHE